MTVPAARPLVLDDGVSQLRKGMGCLDGHEPPPFLWNGRGQGKEELKGMTFAGVLADAWDDAGGGKDDFSMGDLRSFEGCQPIGGSQDRIVIEERLAHAHEHDVRDSPCSRPLSPSMLLEDFPGSEVG